MKRASRPKDREAGAGDGVPAFVDFFEGFVSLDVESPQDRRGQARAIAALVGLGALSAAAAPLFVIAGTGLAGALVPTILSGFVLGGAAALSASGRPDIVGAVFALLFAAVGIVAVAIGTGAATVAAGTASLALSVLSGGAVLLLKAARRRADGISAGDEARRIAECTAKRLAGPVMRFGLDGRLEAVPQDAPAPLGAPDGSLLDRIHVLDRLAFLEAFADLRRGAATAEVELRVSDGSAVRHIALRLAGVEGRDGEPASVLGVARDITQEREAASRLALTLARAEEASEAKSRFLAAISHELRTPLNAIIGFTDILDQEFFGGFESPRQKEYVNLIARSGSHLLDVVNGLLDISRIEAGRYEIAPERFAAREAMEAAAAMVRPQAEAKGLVLIVQEPVEGMTLRADRRAFHQILLNLLSNAVKFTDEGCVRVCARIEGGAQIVQVEDTGVGIAASDLSRIARPFVRLREGEPDARPGSGLGLSLVKGLCELHQGALTIESRPGVGTTASATIPVDCVGRGPGEHNLKEKIVSLTDARKKALTLPQDQTERRSA